MEMPAPTAPGVMAPLGRLGGRVTGQFSAIGLARASAVLAVTRVCRLDHQLPGLSMRGGDPGVAAGRLPAGRQGAVRCQFGLPFAGQSVGVIRPDSGSARYESWSSNDVPSRS